MGGLIASLIRVAAQVYVNSWGACGMWDQIHNLSTAVIACGIWDWMCNLSTEVGFDQNPHQYIGLVLRTSLFRVAKHDLLPLQPFETSLLNKSNSIFDKLFQELPKYTLKNTKSIFFNQGAKHFFNRETNMAALF